MYGGFQEVKKLKCPNCGVNSIPFYMKLFLGPTVIYPKCKVCKKKYGLSNKQYLVIYPVCLAVIVWTFISVTRWSKWITMLVGISLAILIPILCYLFIPLENKEKKG